jgi:RNA polymerase sigma-70 factor (ECF subfamily)
MSEASETFAGLLARARQQDPAALAELVGRYESRVRMVARVLLGPALRPYLDSLDLVQSVHRSLMLGIQHDRFDISTPEQLVALTTTMVRRKVARQWRHMRRQQRLENGSTDPGNVPQLLVSLTSTDGDPAETAQLNDAVQRLWDHLEPSEQRLMTLRLQGYTTEEAADEMGLTPVGLRVRLTRLRRRLRTTGVFDAWL